MNEAEPFETWQQAHDSPAVRKVYEAVTATAGQMTQGNTAMLEDACAAAGVELGAYDARILHWLAGFEPQTCAVIAGLIARAAAAKEQGDA